ncbi:hypothetical protein ACRAWD_04445 [Caulobacter segnis]
MTLDVVSSAIACCWPAADPRRRRHGDGPEDRPGRGAGRPTGRVPNPDHDALTKAPAEVAAPAAGRLIPSLHRPAGDLSTACRSRRPQRPAVPVPARRRCKAVRALAPLRSTRAAWSWCCRPWACFAGRQGRVGHSAGPGAAGGRS